MTFDFSSPGNINLVQSYSELLNEFRSGNIIRKIRTHSIKRIRWLLIISILYSPAFSLAGEPDRAELLKKPRFIEKATEPSFVKLTANKLQDQLLVISSRSYAAVGFNNPEVRIRLPRCDNSVYAVVDFSPARLLDSKGNEVPYERERGIYDYDTYSDELRFAPVKGKTPVEFSRVEGAINLRYPVRMKTLSMKNGSSALAGVTVAIDAPFVSWTGKEPRLPEAASFTPIEQWRAFDASGRRIEKHTYEGFRIHKKVTTETYAYWGKVKEVRVDLVEEWAEVEIVYSLPSIDPLPEHRIGTKPKTDKVKATPGGKVAFQVIADKGAQAEATSGLSKEAAVAQLKKLGFRRFDANSFVLAATRGKADALRLFIAAGMKVDTESGGRTALMSAAMMGHVEAGRVLIEAGADVNKSDVTGSPPLLRLVMKCGATELVQAFINAGADLTVTLRGGVTARKMAELVNCKENARVLKEAEAR